MHHFLYNDDFVFLGRDQVNFRNIFLQKQRFLSADPTDIFIPRIPVLEVPRDNQLLRYIQVQLQFVKTAGKKRLTVMSTPLHVTNCSAYSS